MAQQITPPVRTPQASEIKPIESREQLNITSPTPAFGEAFTSLANTSDFLSSFATQAAQSASIAFSEERGRIAGQNPQGNILPPITNADKVYQQAYNNQAQVTLGLQAQALINKSHEEITKNNLLSDGAISAFEENTLKGLKEISELAPTPIKTQFIGQYANEIQNRSSQLRERLNGQNKERTASRNAAWRLHQTAAMQDLLHENTPKTIAEAKKIRLEIESSVASSAAIGEISPLQAETALQEQKVNYESGMQNGIAYSLYKKNDGTLETYLNELATKKLPGLTWQESQQVGQNVLSFVGKMDALENRNQQLMYTQNAAQIQSGEMTSDKMASLKNEMHPQQYSNLEYQWAVYNKRDGANSAKLSQGMAQYTNPTSDLWTSGTSKDQNAAYRGYADALFNRANETGQPISREEAEFQAASAAPAIPPAYKAAVENGLASGNADVMNHYGDVLTKLQRSGGLKSLAINTKSQNVFHKYEALLNTGMPPQEAAMEARRIVMNPNDADIKLGEHNYNQYASKHFTSTANRNKTLESISGVSGNNITNPGWFYDHIDNMFRTAMLENAGDVEASTKMIQAGINNVWNQTSMNGNPNEITFLPVEQVTNMPSNSIPLFQTDLINQLKVTTKATNESFAKGGLGGSPFKYEFAERPDWNEYKSSKDYIVKNGPSGADGAKHLSVIKAYEQDGAVKIEKVYRNGTRKMFEVNTQAGPFMTYNPNNGKINGGYDVFLRDPETGRAQPMDGIYNNVNTFPTYMPNVAWVKENYATLSFHQGLWQRLKSNISAARKESAGQNQMIDELSKGAF
jgi:hypothetical protein